MIYAAIKTKSHAPRKKYGIIAPYGSICFGQFGNNLKRVKPDDFLGVRLYLDRKKEREDLSKHMLVNYGTAAQDLASPSSVTSATDSHRPYFADEEKFPEAVFDMIEAMGFTVAIQNYNRSEIQKNGYFDFHADAPYQLIVIIGSFFRLYDNYSHVTETYTKIKDKFVMPEEERLPHRIDYHKRLAVVFANYLSTPSKTLSITDKLKDNHYAYHSAGGHSPFGMNAMHSWDTVVKIVTWEQRIRYLIPMNMALQRTELAGGMFANGSKSGSYSYLFANTSTPTYGGRDAFLHGDMSLNYEPSFTGTKAKNVFGRSGVLAPFEIEARKKQDTTRQALIIDIDKLAKTVNKHAGVI